MHTRLQEKYTNIYYTVSVSNIFTFPPSQRFPVWFVAYFWQMGCCQYIYNHLYHDFGVQFHTNFKDLIVKGLGHDFVGPICFNALLSSCVRASKWPLALCWLMQMEQLLDSWKCSFFLKVELDFWYHILEKCSMSSFKCSMSAWFFVMT